MRDYRPIAVLGSLTSYTTELVRQSAQRVGPALQPLRQLNEALRSRRTRTDDPRVHRRVAQPRIARELSLRNPALLNHAPDQRLDVLVLVAQRASFLGNQKDLTSNVN